MMLNSDCRWMKKRKKKKNVGKLILNGRDTSGRGIVEWQVRHLTMIIRCDPE